MVPIKTDDSQYLPPFLMGYPTNYYPQSSILNDESISLRSEESQSYLWGRNDQQSPYSFQNHTASYHSLLEQSEKPGPPVRELFETLKLDENQVKSTPKSNSSYFHSPRYSANNMDHDEYGTPSSGAWSTEESALFAANNVESGYWITVFGFPPAARKQIITHFSGCGDVIDTIKIPSDANWMQFRYRTNDEAMKALKYHRTIVGGNIMIGVKKSINFQENEPPAAPADNTTELYGPNDYLWERLPPKYTNCITYNHHYPKNTIYQNTAVNRNHPHQRPAMQGPGLIQKLIDIFFGWYLNSYLNDI